VQHAEAVPRQSYVIFAVVAIALFVVSVDTAMIVIGMPVMTDDLDTTLGWAGWTITGYQLSQTVMMPIAGKLSDTFGRKRLFLTAVVFYIGCSIAATTAPSIYVLVVSRTVQGLAGGVFLPSATGIVGDAFSSARRGTMIGLFSSVLPVGGMVGPNIGGVLVDLASWRWIFAFSIPFCAALLLFGVMVIPDKPGLPGKHKIDVTGAMLLAAGVISFMYGMTVWSNHPDRIDSPSVWLFFIIGAAFMALLMRQEYRISDPMVDPRLLWKKSFMAVNVYTFIHSAVMFGTFAFIPYYLKIAYGLSGTESGAILTPRFVCAAVASAFASFWLVRTGYRLPIRVGVLIIVISVAMLSLGKFDAAPIAILTFLVAVTGLGGGITNPATNNAALDLEPGRLAAVTGTRGMFRSMGGVVGITVTVVILSNFDDKVLGMEVIFLAMAGFLATTLLLVRWIPESTKVRRSAR
jgi:EmrB/QacA subfamily drug resistance transporter